MLYQFMKNLIKFIVMHGVLKKLKIIFIVKLIRQKFMNNFYNK